MKCCYSGGREQEGGYHTKWKQSYCIIQQVSAISLAGQFKKMLKGKWEGHWKSWDHGDPHKGKIWEAS